jgi:hypothetical protein
MGATEDSACGSDAFYNNDEYCSLPVDASKMQSGVEVQVRNTLVNSKVVDWAGPMEGVTVTCSTSLPPCRGAFLTQEWPDEVVGNGNKTYISENFSLSAYKVDPNASLNLPPMYADFCFSDFPPGATVACHARCGSSACGGKSVILLERNYPSREVLCKIKEGPPYPTEPCTVVADENLDRLVVRVRAAKDWGPLIDFQVQCAVINPPE